MASATEATAHEVFVSTESEAEVSIGREIRLAILPKGRHDISPPASAWGLLYMLHCS
jgi:hypothetical protein